MNENHTCEAAIVIPLLRQRTSWLERSVVSALNQSVPCNVVVVSSPLTPSSNRRILSRLRASHRRLEILTTSLECAFACALNVGITHAPAERVGFLLADDWLEPDTVECCLRCDADIVSTQATIYAADGVTVLERGRLSNAELAKRESLEGKADYLSHFLLFRRQRLLDVGGVDTRIGSTGPDDYDLLWTLLEHGATAVVVEKSLYNYRDHAESWRLCLRPEAEQLDNLERIFDKHRLAGDVRQALCSNHRAWFGKTIRQVREGRR